jgi:hypothetical protein
VLGASGSWARESGTLVVELIDQLTLGIDYMFDFTLMNAERSDFQLPPDVFISASGNGLAAGAINVAQITMTPANATLRALQLADFFNHSIRQTLVSAGDLNNISLSIMASFPILASLQVFTIIGLTGSLTPSGPIRIHSMYASTANWTQESGSMVFKMIQDIAANQEVVFSVELRNPTMGQDAPAVLMQLGRTSLDARAWTTGIRSLTVPSNLHFKPLQTAYLTTMVIGQSDHRGTYTNRLSVTLVPRVDLGQPQAGAQPCSITISGLANAFFASSRIRILNSGDESSCAGNCSRHFSDSPTGSAGFGHWKNATEGNHSLVLHVIKPLLALNIYKFAFEITNPAAGQASPAISIETDGFNSRISRVAMVKAGGEDAPLVIAGFAIAKIGQSTPSHGANNRLSVTLVPYTKLFKGLLLTISGLNGAFADSGSPQ